MHSWLRSLVVTLLVLLALAAISIASRDVTGGMGPTASDNIAAVRHHFTFCKFCRESGFTPERLASERRPIPCLARDQRPATD